MIRTLLTILMLSAVAGGAYLAGFHHQPAQQPHDPVVHRPSQPRIEQVRALASLVTLDVPISDVHVSELEGRTGGVEIIISVRGDVQIMTDLEQARFEDIDAERQEAVLLLPKPEPQRPRVDHEKTRIVNISRRGLWRIAPGDGGEQALTNRAMMAAQRVLADAADNEELVNLACGRTEQIMREFFAALDWSVTVRWMDAEGGEQPTVTASAARP